MSESTSYRFYAFPWELRNGCYIRRLFRDQQEIKSVMIQFNSRLHSWTSAQNSAHFYVGENTSYEGAMSKADRRLKKMGFIFIKPKLVVML